MMGNDKTAKLQLLLCELKLEQRHVNTDMSRLIRQGKTIDFFKAKQLNARKSGLAEKINKVENSIFLSCFIKNYVKLLGYKLLVREFCSYN